jgi:hypothetical protein
MFSRYIVFDQLMPDPTIIRIYKNKSGIRFFEYRPAVSDEEGDSKKVSPRPSLNAIFCDTWTR